MKRLILPMLAAVFAATTAAAATNSVPTPEQAAVASGARAWRSMDIILKHITPPKFPAREFDITKFGAAGDGKTDCTKAFADAIAACNKAGGVRNVFAENCQFDSPDLKMALRLKSNPRRGGFIENYFVRNCRVKTAVTGIHMTMKYEKISDGPAIPYIRNVDIRNVTFENLKQGVVFEGLSEQAKITDVAIVDCEFKNAKEPNAITNAERVYIVQSGK